MSLISDLLEYSENDEKIVTSFKTKDNLSNEIFDFNKDGYVLNKEIRKNLINIADEFIDFIGIDIFVHDIILTGSLSNYNWSQFSDVDLHVIVDMSEITDGNSGVEEIVKELFDSKKNLWNEKRNIKIKNFDVELYIQDIEEDHVSSGVYSILNDEWVVIPKKEKPTIDERKILQKSEFFCKKIDSLIKTETTDYKSLIKKIDDIRKKIRDFRQSGLESGGEYSYENLTFKLLRRNGYIRKLLDFKDFVFDKQLSMNQ